MTRRSWSGVVCVTGLALLGGLAWHSAFGWSPLVFKIVAAALVPAAVAVVFHVYRPRSSVAPAIVSFILLCWFLAVFVLHDTIGGVLPGPNAVSGISHGVANGWDGILSVPLPVPPLGEYLLVPVALTWVAAAFGVEIVLRTRHPLAGSIPVALNYGLAIFFGIGGPGPRVGLGALFLAGVLALAGLTAQPIVEDTIGDRAVGTRRVAEVVCCFLLVAAGASFVGPVLPTVHSANPYNPRTTRVPPETPLSTLNPLDELSQWAEAKPGDLLQVRTDDPGPLRMAVLTNYSAANGWTQDSRYEVAGTTLTTTSADDAKSGTESITVQHLVGPWLPAGVEPVALSGVKAYVDPSTDVLIDARPTIGQHYGVTFHNPAGYADVMSPPCTVDAALPAPPQWRCPGTSRSSRSSTPAQRHRRANGPRTWSQPSGSTSPSMPRRRQVRVWKSWRTFSSAPNRTEAGKGPRNSSPPPTPLWRTVSP